VIVVVGRPALRAPHADSAEQEELDGPTALIAVAVARQGSSVELVGSIGDDEEGDRAIVALGRAHVHHAAVLRDPAARTPRTGADAANEGVTAPPLPRLDREDVALGLSYIAECEVLIAAETLPDDVLSVVLEAADYHGARVIAVVQPGPNADRAFPATVTVLESPSEVTAAYADLVATYALALEQGTSPEKALAVASATAGWERVRP
jgi:sugar/nucleoside kinase (ribokinase family)